MGWGGKHPLDVPVFVVTSSVPREWVYEGSPFTFVTDGLESALEQAKAVAGDKDVGVGAASIVQQCLRAGLLDEIHIDLVPVLLGGGVGLFDHLGIGPIDLERTRVIEGAGVTHLTFRVLKWTVLLGWTTLSGPDGSLAHYETFTITWLGTIPDDAARW
jgi:dihydrofolate reductase